MKKRRGTKRKQNRGRLFIVLLFIFIIFFLCFWRQSFWSLAGAHTAGAEAVTGNGIRSFCEKRDLAGYKSRFRMKNLESIESIESIEVGAVLEAGEIDLDAPDKYFTIHEVGEEVFRRINGKSYRENENISFEELRYLKLLHYNYEHEIQVGELIVNEKIAQDCRNIFLELFEQEYEIQSMYLVDNYWTGDGGDSDTNSIEHNNTSAFNYRVIAGSGSLSNHALGCAVDVNPLQNPCVSYGTDGRLTQYYQDMELYLDRTSGASHMITQEDLCYRTFVKYGFSWGGDWENPKDYQHFEKGISGR